MDQISLRLLVIELRNYNLLSPFEELQQQSDVAQLIENALANFLLFCIVMGKKNVKKCV